MADTRSYLIQIAAARAQAFALNREGVEEIVRLLRSWANILEEGVLRGYATASEIRTLRIAENIIDQLTQDLAASVGQRMRLTATRMEAIHTRALVDLFRSEGLAPPTVPRVGARAVQAVAARPELSRAFSSIRANTHRDVDRIIKQAFLVGQAPDQLAMRLRSYIVGADAIPRRFLEGGQITKQTLERLGLPATDAHVRRMRREVGRVSMKAQMIARTEIANVELEVSRLEAVESPVVGGVRWVLSSNHQVEDECDSLASVDWYGMGAGVYDPRVVPPRPHPRCQCGLEHILLEPDEWMEDPGPVPERQASFRSVGDRFDLRPSQRRRLTSIIRIGEGEFTS